MGMAPNQEFSYYRLHIQWGCLLPKKLINGFGELKVVGLRRSKEKLNWF